MPGSESELRNLKSDLESKFGWRVESGDLYGVDFVLYERGHSEHRHSLHALLFCPREILCIDIIRTLRLANTVKKNLILCSRDSQGNYSFIRASRFIP